MDAEACPLGTNPLLESLSPYIPFSQMPKAVLHEPLQNNPWKSMPAELREQFLENYQQHFFPTSFGIDVVARIQNAIRHGLDLRDPRSPAEQKRINQISLLQIAGLEVLSSLTNPATGGILDGMTGSGKSSLIKRALKVIAPDQVICHSKSQTCGWSKLIQITYLYVDFPSNGTRGGLVIRILGAIDALIGTNYVDLNRRLRNLDASLLFVMKVLSMHRVGILVLDEGQPGTFGQDAWHDELVPYLLSLLNLGIPVLMCGQPRAFTALQRMGQVSRRFCEIGHFKLRRADSDAQSWWAQELVPGIMRFNLCELVSDRDAIVSESRHIAAGVPGFFSRIWIEAQRAALRRGGSRVTLELRDLHAGAQSPEIADVTAMARWLERTEPDDLAYGDLERRGPSIPSDAPSKDSAQPQKATPGPAADIAAKMRADEKRRSQRAETQKRSQETLKRSAAPEDLRFKQAMSVLAGLQEAQKELFETTSGPNNPEDD